MLHSALRIAFVLSFAAALGGALGCSSTLSDTSPSQGNPLDVEEASMAGEVNGFRLANGTPAMTLCKSLNIAAAAHADDMRNNDYLSDTTQDGVKTSDRDCDAGYDPACTGHAAIAELVASGNDQGQSTATQWETDGATTPTLLDAQFKFFGVGRAIGSEKTYWAVDMGSDDDASCAGAE